MSCPVLVVLLVLISATPLQPRALQNPQKLTNGVQPNFISLNPSMPPSESQRPSPPSSTPEASPTVPALSTSPSESQRPLAPSTPKSSPTVPALSVSPSESQRPLSPSTHESSSTVPALFVIGDSTVDSGTNNFLGTLARADRDPYGRDFDTHRPTGRFSNGRIPVDYLALHLGLPFVPSYLGHTGDVEDMMHGVNYASSGAGIIFSSGSELGQHISFTQQIQQVFDTVQQLTLSVGEDATTKLISNSVFYISIGTNDYIHYYLRNVSSVQSLYLPWSFNKFLTHTMKQEIKNLYNANVRKVVIMGLPPIGCAPYFLWRYRSQNGECIQMVNDMILELNFALRYMAEELTQELGNFDIIFCDVFAASMDIIKNSDSYGFNVTADACCGLGKHKGMIMCFSRLMACSNASNYIWWDQFHPTDAVNGILADNVWSSQHAQICYPTNLQDMLSRKAK